MKTLDVNIKEPDGTIIFERKNVTAPDEWSERAVTIAASKYFQHDENSIYNLVDRVVNQICVWGDEQDYFSSEEDKESFGFSLSNILVQQRAAFNSPVWFNVGAEGVANQVSACFIYDVEDNMTDILKHGQREGLTFKEGSGAGVNVSKIRAKGEPLSNRGFASGPISFMRIWDQIAGSIKSGGKNRRSAKMVAIDIDHPDVEEFITCKLEEEEKAKALIKSGISPEEAYSTVAFQNANHSIMITDDFMEAVKSDSDWNLINRSDKKVAKTVRARDLFRQIAEVAHATGDPGIQFYNKINDDNPVPSLGHIRSSNPCGEHLAISNSACNLASLNLVAYLNKDGDFDSNQFAEDIHTIITAQDIMINMADYPTPESATVAKETRPLGLGFANLGAYLMLKGLPYDSAEGRHEAELITQEMTTAAYKTSINLAKERGPYKHYLANKDKNLEIARRLTKNPEIVSQIDEHGLRNSQLTLLAPTGTIGFLMDCDTTGIEPLFALSSLKKLAGGGTMEISPHCVEQAIQRQWKHVFGAKPEEKDYLYTPDGLINQIADKDEDAAKVFHTAGEISPEDHLKMVASCQQYLSGGISKTINMPSNATVEDVEKIYMQAWELGVKSVTVYVYGSKEMQPLTVKEDIQEEETTEEEFWTVYRKKLPETRRSITHKFEVGGFKGYITVGTHEDGEPGELFIRTQKQGSTVQGFLDNFATAISLCLQYGVPLETLIDKFTGDKFEPAGITRNEDIPMAPSVTDYIFRWMKLQFLDEDEEIIIGGEPKEQSVGFIGFDGPPCPKCQSITGRNGTCYLCPECGETTGCS